MVRDGRLGLQISVPPDAFCPISAASSVLASSERSSSKREGNQLFCEVPGVSVEDSRCGLRHLLVDSFELLETSVEVQVVGCS